MMRALLVLLMLAGCTLPEVRAYGIPTAPDQPNVCGPASLADPQQELIDELRWQWRLEELEERREWREEDL
jgi:hypothetical protein